MITKRTLKRLYCKDKLSTRKIARIYRCCRHAILYWMKKYKIKRRNIHNPKNNPYFGKYGKKHPCYKSVLTNKTSRRTINGKYLHRVVIENHLGRTLKSSEEVHHIDFNPFNNHISNLRLLTHGEHSRLHRLAYWKAKKSSGISGVKQRPIRTP